MVTLTNALDHRTNGKRTTVGISVREYVFYVCFQISKKRGFFEKTFQKT